MKKTLTMGELRALVGMITEADDVPVYLSIEGDMGDYRAGMTGLHYDRGGERLPKGRWLPSFTVESNYDSGQDNWTEASEPNGDPKEE